MEVRLSLDATGIDKAQLWLAALHAQLPYAISLALNDTAFDVRSTVNEATTRFFNTPNRFTQTAFLVERSTKANLTATIYPEPRRERYLRFGIAGGSRPAKGFELKFLSQVASTRKIPVGTELVPTRTIRTNKLGDISLATVRRISAGLQSTGNGSFFYGVPKGGDRPLGIYRRSKGRLTAYFIALPGRAKYKPRYPMQDVGAAKAGEVFPTRLTAALERAMATAR